VCGTDWYVKVWAVCVCGIDRYGKELACGCAVWYSAVGEAMFLSVFGVNVLQLQVLRF
jgi:hypothetical protein